MDADAQPLRERRVSAARELRNWKCHELDALLLQGPALSSVKVVHLGFTEGGSISQLRQKIFERDLLQSNIWARRRRFRPFREETIHY
jgi:hypothetical protein